MIAPSWLAKLLPITANSKVKVSDPITGEEAVIISKKLLRDKLADAYEYGYSDGQNNPNGYGDKADRDKCVNDITEELNL